MQDYLAYSNTAGYTQPLAEEEREADNPQKVYFKCKLCDKIEPLY